MSTYLYFVFHHGKQNKNAPPTKPTKKKYYWKILVLTFHFTAYWLASLDDWCRSETIGHFLNWLIVENRVNVSDTKIVNYSYGSLYNTHLHIHFIHCKRYKIANTVYMFLCVCVCGCAVCMCWVYIVSVICNWSQVNSLCLRLLAVVFDTLQCVHRTRPNPNLLHVSAYFAYQYFDIYWKCQYNKNRSIPPKMGNFVQWRRWWTLALFRKCYIIFISICLFNCIHSFLFLSNHDFREIFAGNDAFNITVFINLLCICTVFIVFYI